MAQEIMVAGAIYEDVPSVRLPDSHGTFHPFTDTSDTTAVAADVAQGKTFHLADGSAATGTAAGATLVTKSITANGTYSAEDDNADGYSEVTVNVSGGGGSSWTLLAHKEYTFTTEAPTSSTQIDTITVSAADSYRSDKILCGVARKRDFVKQASQHRGTDVFFVNTNIANGTSDTLTMADRGLISYFTNSDGTWGKSVTGANSRGGLMVDSVALSGNDLVLNIYARYLAPWGSMIGTYDLYVYMLDWPSGTIPFVVPTA